MAIKKIKRLLSTDKHKSLTQQDNYFFVHIPKTAGTSFRKALEQKSVVLKDYGSGSADTSSNIETLVYKQKDFLPFYNDFTKQNGVWLSGHVPVAKYLNFVNVSNVVSFVRTPVEQVVSHYNHFVNNQGYPNCISEFIEEPRFCNIQSKLLNGIPISLFGFIGLTEQYNQSIELINKKCNSTIAVLNENINLKKKSPINNLDTSIIKRIRELNAKDIALYNKANELLQNRIDLVNNEWVYSFIQINQQNIIQGAAYFENLENVVELQVFCKGKLITELKANQLYRRFPGVIFPRHRYVGFRERLNCNSSEIELKVKSTNQRLAIEFI